MTTSLSYTAVGFAISSVEAIGPSTVRVRFTSDPKVTNRFDSNDGLNPANYQVSGPTAAFVGSVSSVLGDPQGVDLFLTSTIGAGTWTVLVLGVVADDLTALSAPYTASFVVSDTAPRSEPNGGANGGTIFDFLKSAVGTGFIGSTWDALLYAFSLGDEYVSELARSVYDQLFISSADGKYLTRRANDEGVARPEDIGMSDEQFRELAIELKSGKVTYNSLWRILEIFYGPEAVRASLESVDEPFQLSAGDQLILQTENGTPVPITFTAAQFAQIGIARASEVAATITQQARLLGSDIWARETINPETLRGRVTVFSPAIGLRSAIHVAGGFAQNRFLFDEVVTIDLLTGESFSVSIPQPGVARFNILGRTDSILTSLRIGDTVNAFSAALTDVNKGSFVITAIESIWNGSSFTQWFEVENEVATAQSGPLTTLADDDFLFFRAPSRTTQGKPILSGAVDDILDIRLPVSTVVVTREPNRAAYLKAENEISIALLEKDFDGTIRIATASPHGLTAGDQVIIDGVSSDLSATPILAEDVATTGLVGQLRASQATTESATRSADGDLGLCVASFTAVVDGKGYIAGGWLNGPTWTTEAQSLEVTGSLASPVNRDAILYNYATLPDCAVPAAYGAAAAVTETVGKGFFKVCGSSTLDIIIDDIEFYSISDNAWTTVVHAVHPACKGNLAITVRDSVGDEVVILSGGDTLSSTATATVSMIVLSSGSPVVAAAGTDIEERIDHKGCAVSSTVAMWSGGRGPSSFLALDSAYAIDGDGTQVKAGRMAIARYLHSMTPIGDGRCLAIGGYGRSITSESVDRARDEIEMFDVATGRWTMVGRLRSARYGHQAFLHGRKVYILGGTDDVDSVFTVEVFDLDDGDATEMTNVTLPDPVTQQIGGFKLDDFYYIHGQYFAGDTTSIVMGSDVETSSAPMNGVYAVESVPAADELTIASGAPGDNARFSATGATILPLRSSVQSETYGPYMLDTSGPTITDVETTLTAAVFEGTQVGFIDVADTTDFPDEPGWLLLDLGFQSASIVARYLGVSSTTQLLVDYSVRWPADLAVGATVTLLDSRGVTVVDDASLRGLCYVTASSAGRSTAAETLIDAVEAGPELNIGAIYPSDVGLGNSGEPTTGAAKLSDAVRVWAGGDVDDEVAAAQEEDDL